MANVTQLIKNTARNKKIQQYIVEKDYALSYLLSAIAATDGLSENLVLKGGTALRKTYFPDHRFSEDLDYSTRVLGAIDQIDVLIGSAVHRFGEMLNERGPFQATFEPLNLRSTHPGGQIAYQVRVQFPEQHQHLCRVKVEITIDEPILCPTENRQVLHGFEENFDAQVPVYALVEISAEKLRALLQSKARLDERGWGASRVCRDYYDLWHLLQLPEIKTPNLIQLFKQKCAARKVPFKSAKDLVSDNLLAVVNSEWQQQLQPFVPDTPKASELLPQVQSLILSLWD